jgi:adenosylhomocysteine nucleosidase
MARPFWVAVTGLRAEARLLRALDGTILAGGGDPARLESELRRALAEGAGPVLSFGLAAGLVAPLRPGALVIPDQIVFGEMRYATDPDWNERLRAVLPAAERSALAGVEAPLCRSSDKVALHAATAAVAADMESQLVARLALDRGRPFVAVRAICDPVERGLPPAARIGMRADGGVNVAGVLGSLIARPRQLPELLRVALDARIAMAALARAAEAVASVASAAAT